LAILLNSSFVSYESIPPTPRLRWINSGQKKN